MYKTRKSTQAQKLVHVHTRPHASGYQGEGQWRTHLLEAVLCTKPVVYSPAPTSTAATVPRLPAASAAAAAICPSWPHKVLLYAFRPSPPSSSSRVGQSKPAVQAFTGGPHFLLSRPQRAPEGGPRAQQASHPLQWRTRTATRTRYAHVLAAGRSMHFHVLLLFCIPFVVVVVVVVVLCFIFC